MKTLNLNNFYGGLSLLDPRDIKDNQFVELKNFFYNESKRIQTRRGVDTFGQPIPDAVVLINACDATAGWSVSSDGANLATGTAIRGSNSLSFDIAVAGSADDFALLQKSNLSADITTKKGYVSLWLYVPAAFNTNLTDVRYRLGSDSSNYYEWTLPTLTEDTNNFIVLAYDDATTTGTPVDATITYNQLRINYTASYTNKTGILIDAIYSYSPTSTKPVTSYFFYQRDDTLATTALAASGTNMFLYHETGEYWEVIDTGLTEFEVLAGRTTERTRWSFAVYKNIVYMCNGVDYYRAWNGVTITTYSGQPPVRYLQYMGDRMFGAGDDENPITLYYTAAAPADAATLNANALVVGGDEMGKINALREIGQVILVGKDSKIYSINLATPSALPIDSQNGMYCHRAVENVANGLWYFNETGLDALSQRTGVDGAGALATAPMTADLQPLISQVVPRQYNANCAIYILPLKNLYFDFDTADDNIPDSVIVYSALVGKAWSQYTWPSFYQFGIYIDVNGNVSYLGASAISGQMLQVETGFDDLGSAIDHSLTTKEWDFDQPSAWKDFQYVDIYGLASEGTEIDCEIFVDGESVTTATISDTFIDTSATTTPIGVNPIGINPIGGGGTSAAIDTFPYFVRIPFYSGGNTIQVKMSSSTRGNQWTLDKMAVTYDEGTFDMFNQNHIA